MENNVNDEVRQGEHWLFQKTVAICFGFEFTKWLDDKIDAFGPEQSVRHMGNHKYKYAPLFVHSAYLEYGQPHTVYTLSYLGTVDRPSPAKSVADMPALIIFDNAGVGHFFGVSMRNNVKFRYLGFKDLLSFMLSEDIRKVIKDQQLDISPDMLTLGVKNFVTKGLEVDTWIELGISAARLSMKLPSGVRVSRFKPNNFLDAGYVLEDLALAQVIIGRVRTPIVFSHANPKIAEHLRHFLPSEKEMMLGLQSILWPEMALYGIDEVEVKVFPGYTLAEDHRNVQYTQPTTKAPRH